MMCESVCSWLRWAFFFQFHRHATSGNPVDILSLGVLKSAARGKCLKRVGDTLGSKETICWGLGLKLTPVQGADLKAASLRLSSSAVLYNRKVDRPINETSRVFSHTRYVHVTIYRTACAPTLLSGKVCQKLQCVFLEHPQDGLQQVNL